MNGLYMCEAIILCDLLLLMQNIVVVCVSGNNDIAKDKDTVMNSMLVMKEILLLAAVNT